ncbi:hypothetical protein [Paenibacillus dendritiformis]|uniref:hypothetical protein n=1 Tax=Paenibacillus dendritiformis TaxID=130049 RepID=UPI000DAA9F79|nr:hypothetical protein [Paenibacillus dendritiformis]PZM67557.1 hypothetical protein DOE73_00905 [Paenibacillus dendritiformis]
MPYNQLQQSIYMVQLAANQAAQAAQAAQTAAQTAQAAAQSAIQVAQVISQQSMGPSNLPATAAWGGWTSSGGQLCKTRYYDCGTAPNGGTMTCQETVCVDAVTGA